MSKQLPMPKNAAEDIPTLFFALVPRALVFLVVMGMGPLVGGGQGEEGTAQEEPKERSFQKAIADRQFVSGYLPIYQGEKDLLVKISPEQLDRKMGLSATLVGAIGDYQPTNIPLGFHVVLFEKWGNNVALVKKNTWYRADPGDPIREAVDRSFPDSPISLMSVVATEESTGSVLLDFTPVLSAGNLQFFLEKTNFDLRGAKQVILSVQNHPKNLTLTAGYHFERKEIPKGSRERFGMLADPRSLGVQIQYDLFDLPTNQLPTQDR